MKSLSIALIIITLIVCGCVFGIPEYDRAQDRALTSRALALKERNITIVFVAPKEPAHGMKMAPQGQASDEK